METERREIKTKEGYTYVFDVRKDTGYDATVSDNIVIDEEFDEDIYEIDGHFSKNGSALDIGANIGAFSIYAIYKGAKRVFSFEPESDNFACLENNVKENYLKKKIHLFKFGISDTNKQTMINVGQGASFVEDVKIIPHHITDSLPKQEISVVTLEEAVLQTGRTKFDVVKVDVEGSEYDIFKNPPEYIMNMFKYITMEFHITSPEKFGNMIAMLSKTHKVRTLGSYETGGNLWAEKY